MSEHPVSVLLADVVMPSMNGRQLADAATKIRTALKVLNMTGYTSTGIVDNSVIEQGIDVLMKPFTPAQFARGLTKIMGHQP